MYVCWMSGVLRWVQVAASVAYLVELVWNWPLSAVYRSTRVGAPAKICRHELSVAATN